MLLLEEFSETEKDLFKIKEKSQWLRWSWKNFPIIIKK
jgi:hypothetical protein